MQVGGQQHGEKYLSLQKIDPDVRFILGFFFFLGPSCICTVVVMHVYMKVLLKVYFYPFYTVFMQ